MITLVYIYKQSQFIIGRTQHKYCTNMENNRVSHNYFQGQHHHHEPQDDGLIYPKFIQRIIILSTMVFLSSWLIPKLPWRPKRIEDYLQFYRMIFEAFRTWSMVSTALTTIIIFSYFTITGAYNWRRQYTQSTRTQKAEQKEEYSENDRIWKEIQTHKLKKTSKPQIAYKKIENEKETEKFIESIKVFEYLDGEALKETLRESVLMSVSKGEKLVSLQRTDLVFVTFGSFNVTFIDPNHNTNRITVTCKKGKTLTSYSNVMRAFGKYYNKIQTGIDEDELLYINAIAQEDSQVLIINERSFIKLAKTSKLSVAHLTQVILSRFKRAAIPIIFDYFNLSTFSSSFLGYFLKKSQGFNDVKLADLLTTYQESLRNEERLLKVIFQYLIGTFELDHSEFSSMESSLSLLQSHIQIRTSHCNAVGNVQDVGEECKGAFLVLEGKLKVSFNDSNFIEASVGDFVGIISSLMGKCSSIQVKLGL